MGAAEWWPWVRGRRRYRGVVRGCLHRGPPSEASIFEDPDVRAFFAARDEAAREAEARHRAQVLELDQAAREEERREQQRIREARRATLDELRAAIRGGSR